MSPIKIIVIFFVLAFLPFFSFFLKKKVLTDKSLLG